MIPDELNFPDPELSPEDDRLLGLLLGRLGLGEDTIDALEAACPPVALTPSLKTELGRIGARAAAAVEFQERMEATRQRPSLGTYVFFLRGRAGLSLSDAAKKLRLPFQWLADLERNALRPQEIPARRLADLLCRLQGSLEQAEELLATVIQAPRWVTPRDSLYRGGTGRWVDPPDQAIENPEFAEEAEAAEALRSELRECWKTSRS